MKPTFHIIPCNVPPCVQVDQVLPISKIRAAVQRFYCDYEGKRPKQWKSACGLGSTDTGVIVEWEGSRVTCRVYLSGWQAICRLEHIEPEYLDDMAAEAIKRREESVPYVRQNGDVMAYLKSLEQNK